MGEGIEALGTCSLCHCGVLRHGTGKRGDIKMYLTL